MASEKHSEDLIGCEITDLVQHRMYICRLSGRKVLYLGNISGPSGTAPRGLTCNTNGDYLVITIYPKQLKTVNESRA